MTQPGSLSWSAGAQVTTVFRRADGSVSGRYPMTVVSDDGTRLLAWVPVGTAIEKGVLADGRDIREADLDQRFRLPRKLIRSTWTGTSTLRLIDEEHWSSLWWFFDGTNGTFLGWYVNLEIPLGRSANTVERCDGVLDVWVEPDRTWTWKDEDELAAAVDAGRLTGAQVAALRKEGLRMIALAEAGLYPFDGTNTDFAAEKARQAR